MFAKWIEHDNHFLFQDFDNEGIEISSDEHTVLLDGQANGQRIVPGPAGKPVLADPPAPTEAELAAMRRAEIKAALTALDAASARPLRAVLTAQATGGTPAADDLECLAELESKAVALRSELEILKD